MQFDKMKSVGQLLINYKLLFFLNEGTVYESCTA